MRSALLDLTPIIPATACHQRNYVERYSRFIDDQQLAAIGDTHHNPPKVVRDGTVQGGQEAVIADAHPIEVVAAVVGDGTVGDSDRAIEVVKGTRVFGLIARDGAGATLHTALGRPIFLRRRRPMRNVGSGPPGSFPPEPGRRLAACGGRRRGALRSYQWCGEKTAFIIPILKN